MIFRDRTEAGDVLAGHLRHYAGRDDVLILALPRGGVPVAYEVADRLHVPLDVVLVQKLGTPGQEELAMGALASGGVRVLNQHVVQELGISQQQIEEAAAEEQQELERRERAYRGNRPPLKVKGKTVVLIDDGLATGSSMRAAISALRQMDPLKIVVAVPVASQATCEELGKVADEVICAAMPVPFLAVGQWYHEFSQTTDEEVRELLDRSAARDSSRAA
jgi:putative phosphoribosyl transferase